MIYKTIDPSGLITAETIRLSAFTHARQAMLDSWLAWTQHNPPEDDMVGETAATASAMLQLSRFGSQHG